MNFKRNKMLFDFYQTAYYRCSFRPILQFFTLQKLKKTTDLTHQLSSIDPE